jgi:hypothetical protein
MTREDFRIVQKYYTTSSLVMIFYGNVIIESVEIYKNYSTFEDEADKAARLAELGTGKKAKAKPIKMKTSKDDRSKQEIASECESKINKYIKANS